MTFPQQKTIIYQCPECFRIVTEPLISCCSVNKICKCTFPDHVNMMEEMVSKGQLKCGCNDYCKGHDGEWDGVAVVCSVSNLYDN